MNQERDRRPEEPKLLAAYSGGIPQWVLISIIVIILVIGALLYFQSRKIDIVPTATPTVRPAISPTPSATVATPTKAPTPTDEPIPTIKQVVKTACGAVSQSITLQNDLKAQATCFTVISEGVTIDCNGFVIDGGGVENSSAIYSEFANTAIKNCNIGGFEVGVWLKKADGSSVLYSTIANNIGGIVIEKSKGVRAKGNRVYNSTEVAIMLSAVEDSTIEDNFADGGKKYGIQMVASNGNAVRRNVVYGMNIGLQLSQSRRNEVEANNISFNFAGMKMTSGSTDNTLTRNNIVDNKAIGLHILDSNGNRLIGNTMTGNEYGIHLLDSRNTLQDNYVCGNVIEDIECEIAQENATGNTCFLRAMTCGFDCARRCPT